MSLAVLAAAVGIAYLVFPTYPSGTLERSSHAGEAYWDNDRRKAADAEEEERFYFVEQMLPGKFQKYSCNTGYWEDDPAVLDRWLLEFALWTAEVTKGFMMVSDLQGCRTAEGYQLTDPVILCKDVGRFSSTNLGEEGIERCIESAAADVSPFCAYLLPVP